MNIIKIAIADDHSLFRTGVKLGLQSRSDIQFVAEAENGLQLLKLLQHIKTDVVILDIQMPVMDGFSTLLEIKKLYPEIKIIFLSMHNDHSVISKMMEMGANSYLTKESGSQVIYEAIVGVYKNEFFFNELTNAAILSGLRTKESIKINHFPETQLSDKETQILRLLCLEKNTREIADIVDLSSRTVEAIRDKLKTKIGVKSSAGLIMYAVKAGIFDEEMEAKLTNLTTEQISFLYKISTSIISFVNHDLAGQRSIAFNCLEQIKEEVNGLENNELALSNVNILIDNAIDSIKSISSINQLIKSYSNISRSSDPLKLFVTKPSNVIESIKLRYSTVDINMAKSGHNLRIIYPLSILYSIFSEIVENAKKVASNTIRLNFAWQIKDNRFLCEIHDDGPGFPEITNKQFVPLSSLQLIRRGMGLKIMERTILESGGKLLFSKSEDLKGAKIYFELPVYGYAL